MKVWRPCFSRVPHRIIAALLAIIIVVLLPSVANAQSTDDRLVSADGVGNAVLGLTVEELTAALGDEYDVSDVVRITVDFDGHVISRDGEVEFRAAMTGDTDRLTLFIVSNADYATAEGVGPGTTIADAEAVYGDALLAWNPDNEGREFVSFADGPGGRVAFRTPGIGGTNVGIYADDEFETSEYEDDGAIAALWVSCIAGTDCPGDRPTPTPTPTAEATPTPEPADDSADDAADDGASGDDTSSELPRTGTTELVLLSIVALLFIFGGVMLLVERRIVCPAWLDYRKP